MDSHHLSQERTELAHVFRPEPEPQGSKIDYSKPVLVCTAQPGATKRLEALSVALAHAKSQLPDSIQPDISVVSATDRHTGMVRLSVYQSRLFVGMKGDGQKNQQIRDAINRIVHVATKEVLGVGFRSILRQS